MQWYTGFSRRAQDIKALIRIPIANPFNFRLMVLSHGWVDLPPFEWDPQENRLRMVVRTRRDRAFALEIESLMDCRPGQELRVQKVAGPRLSRADLAILEERIRWCFRLDTDFRPFQAICARTKGFGWVKKHGLGPLLRTPDLFEEFVKILMTTNVTWSGTKLMNRLLLEVLGQPVGRRSGTGGGCKAFPLPEAVAVKSEGFLRRNIKLGYRAPFLKGLAKRFVKGEIDPAGFIDPAIPTADLAKTLGAIKGFGPYSVNSLLITFGRFENMIIDSWIRKVVSEQHFEGKKVPDATIRNHYAQWGKWTGLACWFECIYNTWMKDELRGRGRGNVVDS